MKPSRLFFLLALAVMLTFCICETMASPAADRIPVTNFSSAELKDGIPPGWNLELRHGNPNIRIEKLDLELSNSDQLIKPLFGHRAVALSVHANSVSSGRNLSVDEHAKSHKYLTPMVP